MGSANSVILPEHQFHAPTIDDEFWEARHENVLYSTVRHRGGKRLAQTYSLANVTRGINRYKKKGGNRNEDIEDSILGNPKSASRSKMEWTMTLQCDLQTRRATVLAPQHWGRLKVIRSCVRSTRDSALERSATLYDVTSHPVSEVRQIEHIVDGKLQGGNVHMPPAEADVVNGQADIILSLGNGYIGHIRAHSEYISRRNRQLRQADDEAQLADRSEDLRELLPASAAADANRAGSPIQTLRAARDLRIQVAILKEFSELTRTEPIIFAVNDVLLNPLITSSAAHVPHAKGGPKVKDAPGMQENETRSSSRNAKSARIAPSAVPTSRATFNLDIGLPTQAAEDNDETASDRARTRKR